MDIRFRDLLLPQDVICPFSEIGAEIERLGQLLERYDRVNYRLQRRNPAVESVLAQGSRS